MSCRLRWALSFALSGFLAASASAAPPPPGIITLEGGTTLAVPPGELKKLGGGALPDNLLAAAVYRHEKLPFVLMISEPKPGEKGCKATQKADMIKAKAAIGRDRKALDAILRIKTWTKCKLHGACMFQELSQRSAAEATAGTPFRHAVGYDLCVGEKRVILVGMRSDGTDVDKGMREQMEAIARSALPPPQ
ncbi:MAG: hypothetical protein IV100_33605 [Myxococcales bacterium]|nr:hypothetical protein [Myxococcales bacterium]